jgi:hypothetical protein
MEHSAQDITTAVVTATIQEYSTALGQIEHCLRQLSDEQIWWRPLPEMNSIGNLLFHLAGNLRQWVISGLGGTADTRNRPAEFSELGPLPLSAVWPPLQATVGEVQAVLSRLRADDLLRIYRIQGFEVSGWDVVIHTVSHFRGHTQEITSLSRQILRERYQFKFVPSTKEQGAAT